MPIPSREKNEDKDMFVSRCIKSIIDEYGQEQASAICYKASEEKMSKMEDKEVFVLSPRKSENRGMYLQRCAAHPKMKEQYGDRKERAIFCLTSFNEYYKWWVKMEEFGEEDTKGTALGACITKKKAQGIDYKQAYRECASKVVVTSGPIVLSEDNDNLIIEPVMFQDCPPATLDIPLNILNRQKCIDQAHYGPLDPNLPNEDYWKKKGNMFNTTPEEAKKALCGNCSFFIQTREILDCIAEGLGNVGVDPYDSINAGDLGYCEAYDFKCAASRTCDAWVVGGPIVDEFAEIGPRGGIKESKKAPKSDTPNKDPQGEGTAKGKASGKRGAVVTSEQEKTLQKKVDDFNEKDSNTKNGRATLGSLKSVFQRGLGAYNTSHSPQVKSSEQWAYARVNAFLYLLKNGRPENPKYDTDFDLLPKDHPKAQKMSVEGYVECDECGWEWQIKDGGNDPFICHKCGYDNAPSKQDFADTFNDYPESVKNAAKRAVDYAEENGWGSCGTAVGKQRASQLAKGENISVDTIKRMYSYLSRHKVDLETSKDYKSSCGKLMYDAWGGESALGWSERKLKQLEKK